MDQEPSFSQDQPTEHIQEGLAVEEAAPAQPAGRSGGVPAWAWAAGGAALLLIVGGGAALLLLGPDQPAPTGGLISLDAANPSYTHPDGLTISLGDGAESAQVELESLPQDRFQAGEAGPAWQAALQALPQGLEPFSPVYTLSQAEEAAPLRGQIGLPPGLETPERVDLYAWDAEAEAWQFVPARVDQASALLSFPLADYPVSLMAVIDQSQVTPITAAVVTPGGTETGLSYPLALAEGVSINAEGLLEGEPAPVSADQVLPVVRSRDGGFTDYADPTLAEACITQLGPLLSQYSAVVLDFAPGEGYPDFVAALTAAHPEAEVHVIIPFDQYDNYDVTRLGTIADRVWLWGTDDPYAYQPRAGAYDMLSRLVDEVPRAKAGLIVSGLSVEVTSMRTARPVTPAEVAALFGPVDTVDGYLAEDGSLPANAELALRLDGQVLSLGFDEALGMNYFTHMAGEGETNHVFIGSAAGVQRKLAAAEPFGLPVMAVYGASHPDMPPGLADQLGASFDVLSVAPAPAPEPLALAWRVTGPDDDEINRETGDLNLVQYLWRSLVEPGQYTAEAALTGLGQEDQVIGEVAFTVTEGGSAPAAPRPTVTPTPADDEEDEDPPAAPAGSIAAGSFELGGQTHTLAHPDQMRRAGMTWVKFQHKWSPGDDAAGAVGGRIAQARAAGFKVLLSIPGQLYPTTTIDYAAYVRFLGDVAALGPDAIEVWNEQNIDREWPVGQISGASYTENMLAPAYAAIKAANPNVIVVGGAPAPTGFFNGCAPSGCDDWVYLQQMADAGAARYMDCMGVHYNEGIIPPSQRSGDPRDGFYSRYFWGMTDLYYNAFGRPLCYTELGYLSSEGYGPLPGGFAWASETSVAEQAAWLAEAAVLSSQSGKVRMMIIFNVDFTLYSGSDPQAGFAMIRPGGACPACDALAAVQ